MPPLPGEERLLTVFADIHSYFTVPTPKPLHHRFDKGSYLYIYHDDADNKARIEVANNPGTSDQDAFHGGLENVHIRHSTQFPTQCTLTVDGLGSPHQPAHYEWRLPSGDPRNERHSLLRLHTLDIYFWTLEDANQFLRHRPAQSEQPMSSVVQQLENVAVTDPAYQNGQTRNSRSEIPSGTAPAIQGIQQVPSFPPPPPSGPTADEQQPSSVQQSPVLEQKTPESFAPLPYNPAAPAAPEPIKHREKTPPPEDGANGTGLAAAVAADHGVPYTPPSQVGGAVGMAALTSPQASQGISYNGPSVTGATGYASPPPSAGLTNPATLSSRGSIQSPGIPSYQQSFQPSTPGSMSFAPPPQDPNAHLYAQQQAQQAQQQQQLYGSPQSPPAHQPNQAVQIAGYSNFSYDKSQQPQQQTQPGASEYDVHNQLYRPTETEANSHVYQHAQKSMKNSGTRGRKLEDKADKLESGMNRFFKKLEKKF
ncbi:hypothetical protein N7481_003892 [Penicillium waksmanii]|uniref:uncharacterized protein n=1 Tax=Penicillium waksmanii TaxID=69791 RepID=UPI0025478E0B|nr:uncharacterized protein N7481_003892 [Penicillium waksmanii]KAJ5988682.1 hypothetical protein N7481_003892 [Penicillium waksmanii]